MNEGINKKESEKNWTLDEAKMEIGFLFDKAGVMGVNESETTKLHELLFSLEKEGMTSEDIQKAITAAHAIFNSKGENNF